MQNYRKLEIRILNDEKFRSLSDDAKLLFFTLYFHPHSTSLGAFRISPNTMASDLNWPQERLDIALERLTESLLVRVDKLASYCEFPNFLKHNKPESPNVIRSWEHYWDKIPECRYKRELFNKINKIVEGYGKAFGIAFREVFGKASPKPKASPNTETETETYTETEKDKKNLSSSVDDIFAFCFQTLPIKPNKKTTARINQIKTRLNQYSPEEIKLAINTMKNDKWLMGENPDSKTYLTFEYIFKRSDNIGKFLDIAKSVKNIQASLKPKSDFKLDYIPEDQRESPEVIKQILSAITKKV